MSKIEYETDRCMVCGNSSIMLLDASGFLKWRSGEFVQWAFPDMSPDDREMLISGTHPQCWDKMTWQAPWNRDRLGADRKAKGATEMIAIGFMGREEYSPVHRVSWYMEDAPKPGQPDQPEQWLDNEDLVFVAERATRSVDPDTGEITITWKVVEEKKGVASSGIVLEEVAGELFPDFYREALEYSSQVVDAIDAPVDYTYEDERED